MEMKPILEKAAAWLTKYRYAACVLLVGIVLMLIPGGGSEAPSATEPVAQDVTAVSVEEQLSALLSKIQGAGRVEVMLSYASGTETRYHTDTETDGTASSSQTVLVAGADRSETALVTRVDPPEYLGAIVVCQGADSAAVRLAITEALSKYTGLGADQIAVLKMK